MLGVPVFAEGSGATITIDSAATTTALGTLQTQLGSYVSAVLPYLFAVAGVFMVIWLARLVLRLVKSFGGSAS